MGSSGLLGRSGGRMRDPLQRVEAAETSYS